MLSIAPADTHVLLLTKQAALAERPAMDEEQTSSGPNQSRPGAAKPQPPAAAMPASHLAITPRTSDASQHIYLMPGAVTHVLASASGNDSVPAVAPRTFIASDHRKPAQSAALPLPVEDSIASSPSAIPRASEAYQERPSMPDAVTETHGSASVHDPAPAATRCTSIASDHREPAQGNALVMPVADAISSSRPASAPRAPAIYQQRQYMPDAVAEVQGSASVEDPAPAATSHTSIAPDRKNQAQDTVIPLLVAIAIASSPPEAIPRASATSQQHQYMPDAVAEVQGSASVQDPAPAATSHTPITSDRRSPAQGAALPLPVVDAIAGSPSAATPRASATSQQRQSMPDALTHVQGSASLHDPAPASIQDHRNPAQVTALPPPVADAIAGSPSAATPRASATSQQRQSMPDALTHADGSASLHDPVPASIQGHRNPAQGTALPLPVVDAIAGSPSAATPRASATSQQRQSMQDALTHVQGPASLHHPVPAVTARMPVAPDHRKPAQGTAILLTTADAIARAPPAAIPRASEASQPRPSVPDAVTQMQSSASLHDPVRAATSHTSIASDHREASQVTALPLPVADAIASSSQAATPPASETSQQRQSMPDAVTQVQGLAAVHDAVPAATPSTSIASDQTKSAPAIAKPPPAAGAMAGFLSAATPRASNTTQPSMSVAVPRVKFRGVDPVQGPEPVVSLTIPAGSQLSASPPDVLSAEQCLLPFSIMADAELGKARQLADAAPASSASDTLDTQPLSLGDTLGNDTGASLLLDCEEVIPSGDLPVSGLLMRSPGIKTQEKPATRRSTSQGRRAGKLASSSRRSRTAGSSKQDSAHSKPRFSGYVHGAWALRAYDTSQRGDSKRAWRTSFAAKSLQSALSLLDRPQQQGGSARRKAAALGGPAAEGRCTLADYEPVGLMGGATYGRCTARLLLHCSTTRQIVSLHHNRLFSMSAT